MFTNTYWESFFVNKSKIFNSIEINNKTQGKPCNKTSNQFCPCNPFSEEKKFPPKGHCNFPQNMWQTKSVVILR